MSRATIRPVLPAADTIARLTADYAAAVRRFQQGRADAVYAACLNYERACEVVNAAGNDIWQADTRLILNPDDDAAYDDRMAASKNLLAALAARDAAWGRITRARRRCSSAAWRHATGGLAARAARLGYIVRVAVDYGNGGMEADFIVEGVDLTPWKPGLKPVKVSIPRPGAH